MSDHPLSWSDGAVPFSERFSDHFYSETDGRAETVHVFLEGNDLPARWSQGGPFTIGELGFGTGLNFLETWRQWERARRPDGQLTFVSFEGFPLANCELNKAMVRWPDLQPFMERVLPCWETLEAGLNRWQMDDQTRLIVVQADVLDGLASWKGAADAWYLDGFAPARNPEMWSEELMQAVAGRSWPGASFASYTAAGWVRRNLQAAGFEVERVPGFGRKRHMIRGYKL